MLFCLYSHSVSVLSKWDLTPVDILYVHTWIEAYLNEIRNIML